MLYPDSLSTMIWLSITVLSKRSWLTRKCLTRYQWNLFLWRSLLAYTCIKLTISPVLSGFQPPNFTQVLLQPSSTCSWLKPHPPINELAIVMALSWQPLVQTGKKLPHWKWVPCKARGLFSQLVLMHSRTAVAHPEPTKVFLLKQNQSLKTSDVTRWIHHLHMCK